MKTWAFSQLGADATTQIPFNNSRVYITSAPDRSRIEVAELIRDPADFHGPTVVDHVVNFGSAMSGLIGTFKNTDGFFDSPDITVLSRASPEAKAVVAEVNRLAQRLIADEDLYNDKKFCTSYYKLAKQGYELLSKIKDTKPRGIPVSLIRAGLVTTRLAHGLNIDDVVPDEIQVETKRAQPKNGQINDLMVTVRFSDPNQLKKLDGADIEIADFVNPASWASTAALLLALKHGHGITPRSVEHRSFMGTMQGVELARRVCRDMGIDTSFRMVGIANSMDSHYYLCGDISVGDAGNALKHFRPTI